MMAKHLYNYHYQLSCRQGLNQMGCAGTSAQGRHGNSCACTFLPLSSNRHQQQHTPGMMQPVCYRMLQPAYIMQEQQFCVHERCCHSRLATMSLSLVSVFACSGSMLPWQGSSVVVPCQAVLRGMCVGHSVCCIVCVHAVQCHLCPVVRPESFDNHVDLV